MEQTLALIKPDVVGKAWTERVVEENEEGEKEERVKVLASDTADAILERATAAGFRVVRQKRMRMPKALARDLYRRHGDKAFIETVTDFMSGGPLVAAVLEKEGAVDAWRALIGATDPEEAQRQDAEAGVESRDKRSLRALFGTDVVANAVHGSSSPYSAQRELRLLFPEPPRFQRTLCMIKPDVAGAGRAEAVEAMIAGHGLDVLAREEVTMDRARAEEFYAEHKDKPFFAGLVEFMTSGPTMVLALEGPDAIPRWRLLMGPTNTEAAREEAPDSVRARFGTDATRNAVHGSDSPASAARELAFWFPDPLPQERTLALVKPGTADRDADAILRRAEAQGFTVLCRRRMHLGRKRAEAFYAEHRGKSFFLRLVDYMTSGPVLALCLYKPGAIRAWRRLMGPTSSLVAREEAPDSLRARFGTDATRNAVHGSDSPASAARELAFWFPDLQAETTPAAEDAKAYLEAAPAVEGAEGKGEEAEAEAPKLRSVLLRGLTELCREKPTGLAAVEWLGRWLVEHNPNQPNVRAPRPLFRPGHRVEEKEGKEDEKEEEGKGEAALPNGGVAIDLSHRRGARTAVVVVAGATALAKEGKEEEEGEEGGEAAAAVKARAAVCELAAARHGYERVQVPALERAALQNGGVLGEAVKRAREEGGTLPPEVAVSLVRRAVSRSTCNRFLVEGLATTTDHVFALEQQLGKEAIEFVLEAGLRGGDGADVAAFYRGLALTRSIEPEAAADPALLEQAVDDVFAPEVVFVLGGPGSGKGTQCAKLQQELGYTHLSTGDLLRAEVASGSTLGKRVSRMIREGQLVPMEVTLRLLQQAMARSGSRKFLVDGFPRTVEQAEAFERNVCPPTAALFFDAPDEVLRKRLLAQRTTVRRSDDSEAAVAKRLDVFHRESMPVVDLYRKAGMVRTVDAAPPVEAVVRDVRRALRPEVVPVVGGPGSGKGTQCAKLQQELGYTHLSTGDLLRAEVARGSDDGALIDRVIREGQLVPMEVTLRLLQQAMARSGSRKFLVDGFPRTVEQAEAFERNVCPARLALFFDAPDEVLKERLLARGATSGRSDDNEAAVAKRLDVFHRESMPVVDHFAREGKVCAVDARGEVDEVFASTWRHFAPEVVFVLGGPGSGKGTQCAKLASEFHYTHLSTGDLLRAEVARGSRVGLECRDTMERGGLVPMEVTLRLLQQAMARSGSRKFLVDGFPRTVEQAEAFERNVCPARLALFFDCPETEMRRRLLARGATSGRSDDTAEAAAKRFRAFQEESMPVVRHLAVQGRARVVNAVPDAETVYMDVRPLFQPRIVLLAGATGSGRGTLASQLGRAFGYTRLRVTDLLRAEAAHGGEVGSAVADAMAVRRTVPTHLVLRVLRRAALEAGADRLLVDGFPRMVSDGFPLVHDQVDALERDMGRIDFLLHLDCDRAHRVERTGGNAAAVDAATETFQREKLPVVRHFEQLGRAFRVDANVAPDDVFQQCVPLFERVAKEACEREAAAAEAARVPPAPEEGKESAAGDE